MYKNQNQRYLRTFENSLLSSGLKEKTIKKHLDNVCLYVEDYLEIYNEGDAVEDVLSMNDFFMHWFPEKVMWSSKNSVKESITSFKKFYKCLKEENLMSETDYKALITLIKSSKAEWIDASDYTLDHDFEDFDIDFGIDFGVDFDDDQIAFGDLIERVDWQTDANIIYCVIIDDIQYYVYFEDNDYFYKLEIGKDLIGARSMIHRINCSTSMALYNYMEGYFLMYDKTQDVQVDEVVHIGNAPSNPTSKDYDIIHSVIDQLLILLDYKPNMKQDKIMCIKEGKCFETEMYELLEDRHVDILMSIDHNELLEKKIKRLKPSSQAIIIEMHMLPPNPFKKVWDVFIRLMDMETQQLILEKTLSMNSIDQNLYDIIASHCQEHGKPMAVVINDEPLTDRLVVVLNLLDIQYSYENVLMDNMRDDFYRELQKAEVEQEMMERISFVKKHDTSLAKCLNGLPIKGVRNIYDSLRQSGKKNKKGMIRDIEAYLKSNSHHILNEFMQIDLNQLSLIMERGIFYVKGKELVDYYLYLMTGFCYVMDIHNQYALWMPEDLKEVLRPHLPKLLEQVNYRNQLVSFTTSCMNLYGALHENQYFEILKDLFAKDEAEYEIYKEMYDIHFVDVMNCQRDEAYLYHTDVAMDYDLSQTLLSQNKPYYIPSLEELLKYEDETYIRTSKEKVELERILLSHLSIPEHLSDDLIYPIKVALESEDLEVLIDVLEMFQIDIESDYEAQRVMERIMAFKQEVRMWIHHGHTEKEVNKLLQRHHLKVGRNSPCPCGSGKKYKKCCGK